MTHRMTWPEVICIAIAVLGIAASTAAFMAGQTTPAFIGVMGVGAAWAVYHALAQARDRATPRLDAPEHLPQVVQRRAAIALRVMCGRPGCGEMSHLSQMDWDPILGHVCKPYRCKGDEPLIESPRTFDAASIARR
jgi:hypothetical protein